MNTPFIIRKKIVINIIALIIGLIGIESLMFLFVSSRLEKSYITNPLRLVSTISFIVCTSIFMFVLILRIQKISSIVYKIKILAINILTITFSAWFFFCLLLYFNSSKLVFAQQPISKYMQAKISTNYNNITPITLITTDDIQLKGWFLKSTNQEKSPLLIYFGGAAEEVSHIADYLNRFEGWSSVFINYRGYGFSEGKPNEQNLKNDAANIYDTLMKRPDIDSSRIVAIGRSLGTGIVINLAKERNLKGLVLFSAYDKISGGIAQDMFPFVPTSLLINEQFNSISIAPTIQIPALFLIGENDKSVLPKRTDKLIEQWGGKYYKKVILGADHNNLLNNYKSWDNVEAFLKDLK